MELHAPIHRLLVWYASSNPESPMTTVPKGFRVVNRKRLIENSIEELNFVQSPSGCGLRVSTANDEVNNWRRLKLLIFTRQRHAKRIGFSVGFEWPCDITSHMLHRPAWRLRNYSFVSLQIILTSLTLKQKFFWILFVQSSLERMISIKTKKIN